MLLKVRKLREEDVYKDIVRIPETHRKTQSGARVKEGSICEVSTDGRTILACVRGWLKDSDAAIYLDDKTRNDLGITVGNEYYFELTTVQWPRQLSWAWNASDASVRIAARLGVLSLFLGVLGFALGIVSLILRKH